MFEEHQIGLPGSHNPLNRILQESGISHQWLGSLFGGGGGGTAAAGGGGGGAGLAGAMIGMVGSAIGSMSQSAQASAARSANRRIAKKQYKQEKKVYKFNWKQTNRQYEHQKRDIAIAKRNNENQVNYQNQTAEQNWHHKLAIQDYQFEQQKKAYDKSFNTYNTTKDFNVRAANIATDSIDNKLGEKFLKTAFDNQQLINDFFVKEGQAKFDKVASGLQLQQAIDEHGFQDASLLHKQSTEFKRIEQQKAKSFQNLQNETAGAQADIQSIQTEFRQKKGDIEFEKASSKLNFEDALSSATFTKDSSIAELESQKAQSGIAKAGLGLDLKQNEQQFKFSQKKNAQALDKLRAQQAFEADKLSLGALEQRGKARLNQAGVSSGGAVVSILASLGQQMTAINDAIMREGEIAQTSMHEAANVKDLADSKAALSGAQVDQSLFDKVNQAKLTLEKADNDLSISGKKTDLTVSRLDKNVKDIAEMSDQKIAKKKLDLSGLGKMTEIEKNISAIQRNDIQQSTILARTNIGKKLDQNKAKTALADKKIDWSLLNDKNKLQLNQQILTSMLDNAVKQSKIDKEKVGADKYKADILAKANLMLAPTKGPEAPKPIDLPYAVYNDPLKPQKPPKPIKGY